MKCIGIEAGRQNKETVPVVAAPPCQRKGAMAAVNFCSMGRGAQQAGNDAGCFAAALAAVNRWAWVPGTPGKDASMGRTIWRSQPGQAGNGGLGGCKRCGRAPMGIEPSTRGLYYKGRSAPPELRWEGRQEPADRVSRSAGKAANKPTLSKREANAARWRSATNCYGWRCIPP